MAFEDQGTSFADSSAAPQQTSSVSTEFTPEENYYINNFNTPLPPEKETEFQNWAEKSGYQNDTYDYDLRGYVSKHGYPAARIAGQPNPHLTDEFKKPNHLSFSEESIYSGTLGPKGEFNRGGHWGEGTFTPSPEMIRTPEAKAKYQDYFSKYEKDYKLNFPQADEVPEVTGSPQWIEQNVMPAIVQQESGGNALARSPKGAMGAAQIMPAMWKAYGQGDPYNKQDSIAAGGKIFRDEYTRFSGNFDLALAAYNAGAPQVTAALQKAGYTLKQAASVPFDEIKGFLPEETQAYVPAVKNNLLTQKKSPVVSSSLQVAGTAEDLKTLLGPIIGAPEFSQVSAPAAIRELSKVWNSRPAWTDDAKKVMKNVASSVWATAQPNEIPRFDEIVGRPPQLEQAPEKPDKLFNFWRYKVGEALKAKGADPVLLGNGLDNYMNASIDVEKQAYNYRHRGTVSSFGNYLLNWVKAGTRGATGGLGYIAATPFELLGASETAKKIETGTTEIAPPPTQEFGLKVNENGYPTTDVYGKPLTNFQVSAAGMLGNFIGLWGIGKVAQTAGASTRALAGLMGGTNVMMTAHSAYDDAIEHDGTRGQALTAAAFSLPSAALTTWGDMQVLAGGPKWVKELSAYNQARYLGRNALVAGVEAGAAMGGQKFLQDTTTSAAINKNIVSGEKVAEAVVGGFMGGTLGALAAKVGAKKAAAAGQAVQTLRDAGVDAMLAQEFEKLQRDPNKTEASMQLPQGTYIDPDLLEMFGLVGDDSTPGVLKVTKISNHIPADTAGVTDAKLEERAQGLANNLAKTPEPTHTEVQNLNTRISEIRSEQKSLGEGAKQAYEKTVGTLESLDKVNSEFLELKQREEIDPIKKELRQERLKQLQDQKSFLEKALATDETAVKYAKLEREARELNTMRSEAYSNTYANDRAAKERELKQVMEQRIENNEEVVPKVERTAEKSVPEKPIKPPYKGVAVKGTDKRVTTYDGKYFVVDREGKAASGGFLRFRDAQLEALSPSTPEGEVVSGAPLAPISKPFVETVPNRPYTADFTPGERLTQTSTKEVNPRDLEKAGTSIAKAFAKEAGAPEAPSLHEGGRPAVRNKALAGYYTPTHRYMWMRRFNDIGNFFHELTHALQDHLYPSMDFDPAVKAGLINTAETTYPAPEILKTDTERLKEGMAMFMQHYLTGQPVERHVLDWYENQFKAEHPEIHAAFENLKPLVKGYYSMEPFTRAKVFTSARPYKKSYTTQDFIDRWVRQERVFEDIDKAFGTNIADVLEAYKGAPREKAMQFMNVESSDMEGNRFPESRAFKEAVAPAKGLIDYLTAYQLARYTQARAESKTIVRERAGVPVIERVEGKTTGFPLETARQITDIIDNAGPETINGLTSQDRARIRLAANQIITWHENVLDTVARRSNAGAMIIDRIRQDNQDRTQTDHGYYIPFAREFTDVPEAPRGRTYTGVSDPFMHFKGSTRRIENPNLHWEGHVNRLLTFSEKAHTYDQLISLLRVRGSPVANYIRKIPKEMEPHMQATVESLVKDIVRQTGFGPEDARDLLESVKGQLGENVGEEVINFFRPEIIPPKGSEGYATIMHRRPDGKTDFYEVNPRILRAMDTTAPDIIKNPLFYWLVAFPNVTLKMGATTFRMAYQLRNFLIRDPMTAYRRLPGISPIPLAREMVSTLMSELYTSASGGKYRNDWVALSQRLGAQASVLAHVGRDLEAEIFKQTGKKPINIINSSFNYVEDLLSVGERATRLASMKLKAKELGITDPNQRLTSQQAIELILAYKRSTTNFQNQGSTARWVNTGIPFFTARIAEVTQLEKDWDRHRGKSIGYALGFLALGLYQAFDNKDESFWQNMEPEEKATNFITRVGDKIVKIPLESLAGVFNGVGNIIGEEIYRQDLLKPTIAETTLGLLKNYLPITSIADPAGVLGKEAFQQAMNKDFYTKRQIVPRGLEDAPKTSQYTVGTTELSKVLSEDMSRIFGETIAPARMDHLIRSLFPAGIDAIRQVETQLGLKPVSEQSKGLAAFLEGAVTRYGFAQDLQDRSLTKFYELQAKAKSLKDIESPREEVIRKKLDSIRQDIGALNTVLSMETDPEERKKYSDKKAELLERGIAIAQGEELGAAPIVERNIAKQIRKQRQRERAERMQEEAQ